MTMTTEEILFVLLGIRKNGLTNYGIYSFANQISIVQNSQKYRQGCFEGKRLAGELTDMGLIEEVTSNASLLHQFYRLRPLGNTVIDRTKEVVDESESI